MTEYTDQPIEAPAAGTTPGATIDVSVVLPVHRSVDTLGECLDSLGAQTLAPERFEVVAVFNGEDDGSRALAEQWAGEHPGVQLVLLDSPVASAGAARNVALDAARGENVTFVDADDWVSPEYLEAMVGCADGHAIPVAGLVDIRPDGTENDDTSVMRSLSGRHRRFLLSSSQAISAMMAAKLLPREAVERVRFNTDLRSGEDVVFNAQVFGTFARRFAMADQAPRLAGATYYRRLTEGSVSRQELTRDFAVDQRLAVIRVLTEGGQANPEERTPMVKVAIDGQLTFIDRYLAEHPQERPEVEALLAHVEGAAPQADDKWPAYSVAFGNRGQQPATRITLIAGPTKEIQKRHRDVALLRSAGVAVQHAFFSGAVDQKQMLGPRLRLTVAPEVERIQPAGAGLRSDMVRRAFRFERRSRKLVRRAAPHVLPARALPFVVSHSDDRAAEFMEGTVVIALDASGESVARAFGADPQPAAALAGLVLSAAAVTHPIARVQAAAVRKAARLAATLPDDSSYLPPARVWAFAAWRLLRSGRAAAATEVLEAARERFGGSAADEVGVGILQVLAGLSGQTELAPDWQDVARTTLAAADEAYAAGDVDRAAFLMGLVCEVAFHSDLQANVPQPPLLEDPEAFLAPLTESVVWQELVNDSPRAEVVEPRPMPERPRVLVVPGCYPKFAGGIIEALEDSCEVEEVPLQEMDAGFGSIGPRPHEIAAKLRGALSGRRVVAPDGFAEVFTHRNVVFVDWVDRGAVLASLLKPAGTKLVVRFHGVDSLSMWQYLVDWTQVDEVVFVSEHLRRSVERTLGDRIAHCTVHVTGNVVDVDRFSDEKTPEASRTLGLVGWAQRVKDPLWALEVLSILRAQDPTWKLKLVGTDFPMRQARVSEDEYAQQFRQRIQEPDVADGVEYVDFSRNLPRHLKGIGFALSTSLRESWHIGVVEMAASGAVPVVRDWPVYRRFEGARGLYGDWVVETPQEAADRIRSMSDESVRAAAAHEAREQVRQRFGQGDTAGTYRRIILGQS